MHLDKLRRVASPVHAAGLTLPAPQAQQMPDRPVPVSALRSIAIGKRESNTEGPTASNIYV